MIEYDRKERAVVWKMSPRDAAHLAEFMEANLDGKDRGLDDAKRLHEAAYEGLLRP